MIYILTGTLHDGTHYVCAVDAISQVPHEIAKHPMIAEWWIDVWLKGINQKHVESRAWV